MKKQDIKDFNLIRFSWFSGEGTTSALNNNLRIILDSKAKHFRILRISENQVFFKKVY